MNTNSAFNIGFLILFIATIDEASYFWPNVNQQTGDLLTFSCVICKKFQIFPNVRI